MACARTPEPPSLPGPPSAAIDQVILSTELTNRDVRKIFQALNRQGRLAGLTPWFEEEANLKRFTSLFNDHVLDTALSREGLVPVLEGRVGRVQAFFDWLNARSASQVKAVNAGVRLPGFPVVARQHRRWLEPRVARAFSVPKLPAQKWPKNQSTITDLIRELVPLLDSRGLAKVAPALTGWDRAQLPTSLLSGLFDARQLDPLSLVGAGWSLSTVAREDHVSKVMELLRELNRPTGGLFSVLEERLKKNDHLVSEFGRLIEPRIPRSVGGFVAEGLKTPPVGGPFDKEFWKELVTKPSPRQTQWVALFTAVRSSVEKVSGGPAGGFSNDGFLRALPLYLNSYALTRWLEHALGENWTELGQKDVALWTHPLKVSPFLLELTEQDLTTGTWKLATQVKKDLDALGLSDFARDLAKAVEREGFGDFYYDVGDVKGTLAEALKEVCLSLHRSRSFGDPIPLLQSLVYGITRDDGGFGLRLKEFETDNLAVALHQEMAKFSQSGWNRLERWLFEDIGLGKLSSEESQFLLSLYDGHPPLQKRVRRMMDSVPAIRELNRSIGGRPTLMGLYLQLLHHLPPHSLPVWLATWKAVDTTGISQGPEVRKWLSAGRPVTRALETLATVPPRDHAYVADVLGASLAPRPLSHAWMWLGKTLRPYPAEWSELWEDMELAELAPQERLWAIDFLERGGLATLWALLQETSHQEGVALVQELQRLEKSGYLLEAFQLLQRVQNPHLQETARVFSQWAASGELAQGLNSLALWLKKSR